ncbi:MAG: aspartate aminotransferase family protein [Gemmatirosa sp.]|nr:aspartate aminotransferase family protein [Gemmatirosa sp.]
MTSLPDVLAAIDHDASAEAGGRFVTLVADYFARAAAGDGPVSTPHTAGAIAERFAEPLPRTGGGLDEVMARLAADVLPDVNRLYHPMALGHQVSPPLPAAVWTEALTAALNQSTAVWEMSPVATVLEHQVVRWMADLVGFGAAAGGTLTSGGTEATLAALLAARAHALPDAWRDGVGAEPPVVLCGEHAHYAVARAVGQMGLGTRQLVTVPSHEWRMDVAQLAAALDAQRAAERRVMAVVATAGSTATGSFDDLERIADLCDAHDVWLHVDGAHGASALLSAAHRHRVRGLARARSLAWDPHKMMLLPLAAGMVLLRDGADLERAFAQRAPYLFHAPSEGEDAPRVWDLGLRSFQCSRRADVLKLWVALHRYGADGIGALYAHLCETAARLHARLAARDDFEAIHAPEGNILCFRWAGAGVPADEAQADALTQRLRDRYNQSGAGWITTTLLDGRRVLRVTVMNPRTTDAHLAALVDGLAETARRLVAAM